MEWKEIQSNMEPWKPSEYNVSIRRKYLTVANAPDTTK